MCLPDVSVCNQSAIQWDGVLLMFFTHMLKHSTMTGRASSIEQCSQSNVGKCERSDTDLTCFSLCRTRRSSCMLVGSCRFKSDRLICLPSSIGFSHLFVLSIPYSNAGILPLHDLSLVHMHLSGKFLSHELKLQEHLHSCSQKTRLIKK